MNDPFISSSYIKHQGIKTKNLRSFFTGAITGTIETFKACLGLTVPIEEDEQDFKEVDSQFIIELIEEDNDDDEDGKISAVSSLTEPIYGDEGFLGIPPQGFLPQRKF